jgi:UDP-N-acetylmuramate dehydrogenase
MRKMVSTQPVGMPSAGCIFRNPGNRPAWSLIKECGMQGASVGDAQVSTRHANFIVNRGRATAGDVLALMDRVSEQVWKSTGVVLEKEVVIWSDETKQ